MHRQQTKKNSNFLLKMKISKFKFMGKFPSERWSPSKRLIIGAFPKTLLSVRRAGGCEQKKNWIGISSC